MKLGELPGWAIAISLFLIAIVFGHAAFFASAPFDVAGLRFGPVLKADLTFTDAVIAFDRAIDDNGRRCPAGWEPFGPAASRFILGAGPTKNQDMNGKQLTARDAFAEDREAAVGGEEEHALTAEEMPRHSHALEGSEGIMIKHPTEGAIYMKSDGPDWLVTTRPQTDDTGGSQPHNNMPPYIALYFCKKD